MVTEVFVICDAANDSNGKLNILGAFDTIAANEFPFFHPHCAIALRLRYDRKDSQENKIRLAIQEASGDGVLTSIDTVVNRGASSNPTSSANLIVNINSLRFVKPGEYSIVLHFEGIPAAIIPLYVRSSPTSA